MSGSVILKSSPRSGQGRRVQDFFELIKVHLSLYIGLSALAGHVLAQDHLGLNSLVLGFWVLVLAFGAGGLNNVQDREFDRRFQRTRHRVLARKGMGVKKALTLALVLAGMGIGGLYLSYTSIWPCVLGLLALVCYNGLYTPIKKQGLWALVPGVICGMIPPAIGWFAVPEALACTDRTGLVILMACLGFWQLPHYMLVELSQGQENGHSKGFGQVWTPPCLRCQVLIWSLVFSLGLVLFLICGWVNSPMLADILLGLALVLPFVLAGFFCLPSLGRQAQNFSRRSLFFCFNIFNLSMLAYLSIIILDRI
ncbi:MAG: UbiA family prenyltransferase [Desulfobacter sp.]|nr:UbiA family prenyltransferase [Desulfobacter sp.]WDP86817.1 MAG: UbiA family prenyltransferase [Desulfobacter sp.]